MFQTFQSDDDNEIEEGNWSADDEVIEEYIEDDTSLKEDQEEPNVSMPSFKNLQDTSDMSIVKLIEDIEEKNQLIIERLPPKIKKQPQTILKSRHVISVERQDELAFEASEPKLILKPAADDDDDSCGMVIYASVKQCDLCDQVYNTDYHLKRHQVASHPLQEPISCCDQIFIYMKDYRKHRASLHADNSVVCPVCGKILKSKKTFLVHKKSHQSATDRKFKCSFCSKSFNFKLHLENHTRTHNGKIGNHWHSQECN